MTLGRKRILHRVVAAMIVITIAFGFIRLGERSSYATITLLIELLQRPFLGGLTILLFVFGIVSYFLKTPEKRAIFALVTSMVISLFVTSLNAAAAVQFRQLPDGAYIKPINFSFNMILTSVFSLCVCLALLIYAKIQLPRKGIPFKRGLIIVLAFVVAFVLAYCPLPVGLFIFNKIKAEKGFVDVSYDSQRSGTIIENNQT